MRSHCAPEAGPDMRFLRPVAAIVAMSRNRVIARDGKLPWRVPRGSIDTGAC
jgi:hypothetical protein